MSQGFALFWSKMLDSTVWLESGPTRLVWITMLLLKDQHGIVKGFVPKTLANRARVSHEECLKALETFMSPDPDSQSKVDEGRRIREVPGGWFIINHEEYRFSTEAKKAFWRQEKADQRSGKEPKKKKAARPPTMAERMAGRGDFDGEPVETTDREEGPI